MSIRHCLLVLALAAAAASPAFAFAPVTGDDAKVALCMAATPQGNGVFNPLREYGTPIRYVPAGDPLTVVIRGIGYTLDVDAAVGEAMAEWRAAVPSLQFQPVPPTLATDRTWRVEIDTDHMIGGALGGGFKPGTFASIANAVLVLFRRQFNELGPAFDQNVQYLERKSMDDFLQFVLRLTAKHEVGHLLGFRHPPGHAVGNDTDPCVAQAIHELVAGPVTPGPPIMAGGLQTAIRLMYEQLGRPLRIGDIAIAPQEAAAARAAWEQDCPVGPQDPGATARNLTTCLPAKRLFDPNLPALQLLLF